MREWIMPSTDNDNRFARAILEDAIGHPHSKEALARAAHTVLERVIEPILIKLRQGGALEKSEANTIEFLAREHSRDGLQWGGVFQTNSKTQILATNQNKIQLLEKISAQLTPQNVQSIHSIDHLASVTKCLTDACFCYVEYLKQPNGQAEDNEYELLKRMITPTPEELNIRLKAIDDMGWEEQLATTYGIGREPGVDIASISNIPETAVRAHKAGKAVFAMTDVMAKAKVVIKKYAGAKFNYNEALERYSRTRSPENALFLENSHNELLKCTESMLFYRIPLNALGNMPLNPPYPGIQRLAGLTQPSQAPLPLVATASGTTARTLIALQDMGVFSTAGDFNQRTAQYISTLLCGTLVHGGHHSVLEVAEMYNRLIDYHAVNALDHAGNTGNEENMGYYRIGDSTSLIPEDMITPNLYKYTHRELSERLDHLDRALAQVDERSDLLTNVKSHYKRIIQNHIEMTRTQLHIVTSRMAQTQLTTMDSRTLRQEIKDLNDRLESVGKTPPQRGLIVSMRAKLTSLRAEEERRRIIGDINDNIQHRL
jgi:hypothetical protein